MKRLWVIFLMLCMISFPVYSANEWRAGSTDETMKGDTDASDIDTVSYQNIVDPADRLLSNYREGCKVEYLSAATITVTDGEIVCSNATGTIRKFRKNTSNTSVSWADIDAGAEASSTTYYLYAVADADAETFTVTISTNSSTPTGKTYYARLGSFYNDASSNITNDQRITNDNNYYALQLGDWVSKSHNTAYQATTDGFAVGYTTKTSTQSSIQGFTGTTSPGTRRHYSGSGTFESNNAAGCTIPVKRGDYWKIVGYKNNWTTLDDTTTVYWIPSE